MHLIIRNNNILRRGGDSEQFLRFKAFYEGRPDGRTDGQKVIIIAHPEHSSGELKYDILCRLNDIFLFKFPLSFFRMER